MGRLEDYRAAIDAALAKMLPEDTAVCPGLNSGERYSLNAPGKRIRPVLTLEFARLCGMETGAALPIACAVEMLHTYSLIHDDLPCMDNDTLRRGRPTNHVVYGECNAVLAGDSLQADAFSAILDSPLPPERRAECARLLARAAGSSGMCAGQYFDTNPGSLGEMDAQRLQRVHELKTGALLKCACMLGCAAAGAGRDKASAAERFGGYLGLAFQARDDLLDHISTTEVLGKTTGTDERDGKVTFVTLLGEERCAELVTEWTQEAKRSLSGFDDAGFLLSLADSLAGRMK